MANYRGIIEHVKKSEGGYSADPVDNQSKNPSDVYGLDKRHPSYPVHTYKGVAWVSWKAYAKKKGFNPTGQNFVNMSTNQWEDLLKTMYWDKVYGDDIRSQGVAETIFESIWGGGSKVLVRDCQLFLLSKGISVGQARADGAMGKDTVTAINKFCKKDANEKEMIVYLAQKRLEYLQSLNDWWKYGIGWARRVNEVRDKALEYITNKPNIKKLGIALTLFSLIGISAFLYIRR